MEIIVISLRQYLPLDLAVLGQRGCAVPVAQAN